MTLSTATLAGYYCRLHHKFQGQGVLFDRSWGLDDLSTADQLQWVNEQLGLDEGNGFNHLCFGNLVERLILLSPSELKMLLCGLGALAMRGHLRHCIDGTRLRDLRRTVGPDAFNALMQRHVRLEVKSVSLEWSVDSLCVDGLRQVVASADNAFTLPVSLLKFSLPKQFANIAQLPVTVSMQLPIPELKVLYPEFRWLFG